ncbi:MAG TPA: disulfide bond formation protein B [Methylotenera sp.]|nr:disulfide bond formation protein B [Methylotenera sp.]
MLKKLFSGRSGYFLGFIASFGLVGLALVIQTQYHLEPCPLCISQRMVFMGLGLLFLVAAIHKPGQLGRKVYMLLQVLAALGGAGVAIRHWWLQAHRESMIADCGVGFDYMFENFPLQKALTLIFRGTGDCAAIDWTFLGLSLPQLSLIAFVGFAAYAIYLTKKI